MAINLWKLAGNPTSYNPLPVGWVNRIEYGNSDYVMTLKAKSNSGASLRVTGSDNKDIYSYVYPTSEFQEYTFSFTGTSRTLFLYTTGNDVVVEDVKLVEKSAGRATINGIDGFTSGNWVFHENAKVIDDETLEMTSTDRYQTNRIFVPCEGGQPYTCWLEQGTWLKIYARNKNNVDTVMGETINNSVLKFTTPPDTAQLFITLGNGVDLATRVIKRPMVVKGSNVVPYEKKKGTRMVQPAVVGKNHVIEQDITKWSKSAPTNQDIRITDTGEYYKGAKVYRVIMNGVLPRIYTSMKPTTKTGTGSVYIKPINFKDGEEPVLYYRKSDFTTVYGTYIMSGLPKNEWSVVSKSASPIPEDWIFMIYNSKNYDTASEFLMAMPQYEDGANVTEYEPPRWEINPSEKRIQSALKGMSFNGVKDYVAVEHEMISAIDLEVDFIWNGQPINSYDMLWSNNGGATYLAVRTNSLKNYIRLSLFDSTPKQVTWEPLFEIKAGELYRLRVVYDGKTNAKIYNHGVLVAEETSGIFPNKPLYNPRVNSFIGSFNANPEYPFEGTLLRIKLNDLYEFDFTKNSNGKYGFEGGEPENLLPSFDSGLWTMNANARVLGKDVLVTDAKGVYNTTFIKIPCKPNTKYYFNAPEVDRGNVRYVYDDGTTAQIASIPANVGKYETMFTTPANVTHIQVEFTNVEIKTYTVRSPRLVEIPTALYAQIYGAKPLQKMAERQLLAKR
jgi:hypothetical protein